MNGIIRIYSHKCMKCITRCSLRVMTTMFHQCGILMDCNIFEIQNYELFLRALHHHLVMGTINMTQVGHFLILMTYISFCRLNHYTDYLSDKEGAMIEPALMDVSSDHLIQINIQNERSP